MEFTFDDTMPELTLEPELELEAVAPVQPEPPKPKAEEPVLSPAEQKVVDDFAAKIDVENTAQILQYGAGTQKKMAAFSDAAFITAAAASGEHSAIEECPQTPFCITLAATPDTLVAEFAVRFPFIILTLRVQFS